MATKKELEAEIKALKREIGNQHEVLEKHDLLPKEPTLQDVIMQLESDGMIAIQKIADTVTQKTGRPFISINSRVIDFIPTIAMVDDPHIVMVKESDSMKEMIAHLVEHRFTHPNRYRKFSLDRMKQWVNDQLLIEWSKYQ
jgi:hypothetical protein